MFRPKYLKRNNNSYKLGVQALINKFEYQTLKYVLKSTIKMLPFYTIVQNEDGTGYVMAVSKLDCQWQEMHKTSYMRLHK